MQGGNRKGGNRRDYGWLKIVVLGITWLIIASLIRDVWQIKMGFKRISESEDRLVAEKERNDFLKQKMGLVLTESYKEKLIREKLNMQKEGEVLVVLPKREKMIPKEVSSTQVSEKNWEKWWKLLRG